MKNRLFATAILIPVALVLCTSSARGKTLTVGGSDAQFQTIQKALDAASNKDLIQVLPERTAAISSLINRSRLKAWVALRCEVNGKAASSLCWPTVASFEDLLSSGVAAT